MGGAEALPQKEANELIQTLQNCQSPIKRGFGPDLRTEFSEGLKKLAWPGAVKIAHGSGITITSQKNKVGLCVQTAGNMSRMYADLMKLQKMYLDETILVGVLVLPTSNAAKELGSNVANSDRLENELEIFRKVIHMPLKIISFQ